MTLDPRTSLSRPTFGDAVLWACIVIGLYLRWVWGNDFTYVVFTDRDLLRGLDLWHNFQVTGAELGGRVARTPGGLLYYFTNVLQAINANTGFVRAVVVSLDCIVLVAIPFLFAPLIGSRAALFAGALYGATPAILDSAWKFWNPTYALPFAVLIYWLLLSWERDGARWRLPAAFASIGVAQQFHISFAFLLPISVLLLVPLRRRVGVGVAAAALAAWALTLAPYLVVEAMSGWPNTRALVAAVNPQTVAGEPGAWLPHVVTVLSRLTGGRTFFGEVVPAAIEGSTILHAGAFVLFNLGLLLVVAYLALLMWRRTVDDVDAPASNITRGLLWLFIIAVALGLSFDAAKAARYLLFIAVPGVLLAGLAFQALTRAAGGLGKNAAVAFSLLAAAILLARDGAIMRYYLTSPRETLSAYGAKAAMVALLKKTLGYSERDLETRVALVEWKGGGLVFYPEGENLGFTYIARTNETRPAATRYDGCAVIVVNPRRGTPPAVPDARALAAALPVTGPIRVEKSARDADILLLGYRVDGPNCPATYGDPYHLLPGERLAETGARGLASGAVRKLGTVGPAHRFVARLAAGASFAVMVDITADHQAVRAVMHGNSMRGYAPSFRIPRATLRQPQLRFTPAAGPVRVLAGPAALGTGGWRTPWTFAGPSLAPGRYRVELTYAGIETTDGRSGSGAVLLDDGFVVNE